MVRRLALLLVLTLAAPACTGSDDAAAPASSTTTTADAPATVDLSIDGDGFLLVRRGVDVLYTRSGTFSAAGGKLGSGDGLLLEGWTADRDGTIATNDPVGDITMPSMDGPIRVDRSGVVSRAGQVLGQLANATFADQDELAALPGSLRQPTAASGLASVGPPGIAGRGWVAAQRRAAK